MLHAIHDRTTNALDLLGTTAIKRFSVKTFDILKLGEHVVLVSYLVCFSETEDMLGDKKGASLALSFHRYIIWKQYVSSFQTAPHRAFGHNLIILRKFEEGDCLSASEELKKQSILLKPVGSVFLFIVVFPALDTYNILKWNPPTAYD